jgi:hypothetical protein
VRCDNWFDNEVPTSQSRGVTREGNIFEWGRERRPGTESANKPRGMIAFKLAALSLEEQECKRKEGGRISIGLL